MIKAVKDHFLVHFPGDMVLKHWDHHFSNSYTEELDIQDHKFVFRKFSMEDVDKCAELYKEVFSDYPWYDVWDTSTQVKKYLIELIKNPTFEGFVAFEDKEVVAVCFGRKRSWWMGNEFFIDEFFVSNEKQGNGIGTELMNFVKDSLRKEGYKRLTLLTNKGIPAEEFYFKNGFYNNKNRIVMVNEFYD